MRALLNSLSSSIQRRGTTYFLVTALFVKASVALAADGVNVENDPPSAFATVNSIDVKRRTIDLTHDPIPDIRWPSMRMNLRAAPSVDLENIKPGAKVYATFTRDAKGVWFAETIELLRARSP